MELSVTPLEAAIPNTQLIMDTQRRLEDAGVKYVFACWVDLLGIPKTKPIPLSEFERLCRGKGPQFAVHSVSLVPERGPADPDQVIIPDLSSLVLCPWDPKCAWIFADLYFENEPYDLCPRQALKRQLDAACRSGYLFYAGIEPEFMVMRYDQEGRPIKAFNHPPGLNGSQPKRQPHGYDAEFSFDALPFLGELVDMLDQLGWNIANVVCEGAYSQFELDYGYWDPLTTADRFVFLRILLKEVAKAHGMFATFMPKPTQGDWRNGAHISLSFRSVNAPERNLLQADDGAWSSITYQALAGQIAHGSAITAVTCPTVNSYKGLVGRVGGLEGGTVTWAPTHMCYGVNNRSAMLRLPQTRYAIENRASDMALNPYLGLAMIVAATLDGIENGLQPPPAVDHSLYDLTAEELDRKGIKPLPHHLLEAISAFDRDPLARHVFGPTMHSCFSRYKHNEWHRFHEHVTEWEQVEYLRFF